jgi:hypothetical protein
MGTGSLPWLRGLGGDCRRAASPLGRGEPGPGSPRDHGRLPTFGRFWSEEIPDESSTLQRWPRGMDSRVLGRRVVGG